MQPFFKFLGLDRLMPATSGTLLSWIESPVVLAQFGVIVAGGALGFWLGAVTRPLLGKLALRWLPRNWAPTFLRVTGSVVPPLVWLMAAWLAATISHLFGTPWPLVNAGIALLIAWIFIRLLSFTVSSPLASATISVVAWSIAALSILGLLDPLVHQLDASAIHLGKFRLSAMTAINALLFLAALLWLTTILFRFLQQQISRAASLTPSLQVLLTQLLQIILPTVAIIIALSAAGIDLTAFTVVFGAVGLGVGLGLQRVASNLVAGLTLLIGKTIKPGDILEYDHSYGWVTEMGARYVTLRTRDGIEHLIPNDYFLENGVENWSHSDLRLRLHIPVAISYESDVRQAMALCLDAVKNTKRAL